MTRVGRRWLAWVFHRRTGSTLMWSALVAAAAIGVNLVGIHIVGGVDGWERWLRAHSNVFVAWRLFLYALTAWGWRWMRRRVQQREPTAETRRRFLRVELAAVAAIVLMEGSVWLQQQR